MVVIDVILHKSSEEEESESEEEPQAPMFRPMFVPKYVNHISTLLHRAFMKHFVGVDG